MLLDSFGEIAVYDINHIKKNVIKAPTAVKPYLLFHKIIKGMLYLGASLLCFCSIFYGLYISA